MNIFLYIIGIFLRFLYFKNFLNRPQPIKIEKQNFCLYGQFTEIDLLVTNKGFFLNNSFMNFFSAAAVIKVEQIN